VLARSLAVAFVHPDPEQPGADERRNEDANQAAPKLPVRVVKVDRKYRRRSQYGKQAQSEHARLPQYEAQRSPEPSASRWRRSALVLSHVYSPSWSVAGQRQPSGLLQRLPWSWRV
jgi:hypothetical protein